MTLSTVDDIVSGLAVAQTQFHAKVFNGPKANGAFQSGWLSAGFPGAGSAPPNYTAGSDYACDKNTPGAMLYNNAAVQNWLARLSFNSSVTCTLILADRLWACSGMGYAAGTYTITTPGDLPGRITDNGVGVQAFIETYASTGNASGTLVFNYLNANAGDPKSGTIAAVVSAPAVGQMQLIPMAVGDTGVRSPVSVVTNATWTSGTAWGITLLKNIVEIPIVATYSGQVFDWAQIGLPQIPADACLFVYLLATTTTAPFIMGSLKIIDK